MHARVLSAPVAHVLPQTTIQASHHPPKRSPSSGMSHLMRSLLLKRQEAEVEFKLPESPATTFRLMEFVLSRNLAVWLITCKFGTLQVKPLDCPQASCGRRFQDWPANLHRSRLQHATSWTCPYSLPESKNEGAANIPFTSYLPFAYRFRHMESNLCWPDLE